LTSGSRASHEHPRRIRRFHFGPFSKLGAGRQPFSFGTDATIGPLYPRNDRDLSRLRALNNSFEAASRNALPGARCAATRHTPVWKRWRLLVGVNAAPQCAHNVTVSCDRDTNDSPSELTQKLKFEPCGRFTARGLAPEWGRDRNSRLQAKLGGVNSMNLRKAKFFTGFLGGKKAWVSCRLSFRITEPDN
jgi:hypothetical protein